MTDPDCPFCHPDPTTVFHADDQVLGLWDSFPASPGHALLVPRRHRGGPAFLDSFRGTDKWSPAV